MWIVWLIFFISNFVYFIREEKHMKQVTIDKILNEKHTFKKKKQKLESFHSGGKDAFKILIILILW